MNTEETIQSIRRLLGNPRTISEAFEHLENLLHVRFEHHAGKAGGLRYKYRLAREKYEQKGTIDHATFILETNQVIDGVNEILLRVKQEEGRLNNKGVLPGSPLSVYCCDRKEIIKRFGRQFEALDERGEPAQVYLLTEQKYGQTESLARRLVTTLKEEKQRVKYRGFDQIQITEVELDSRDDLDMNRREFLKQINRQLDSSATRLSELADSLARHRQYQEVQYIPLVFRLRMRQSCWPPTGRPLLQWFIEDFCAVGDDFPKTFVFLLLVDIKVEEPAAEQSSGWFGLFGRKKEQPPAFDPVAAVRDLAGQLTNSQRHFLLPPLGLVKRDDLLDWYRMYEKNEFLRERKVAELIDKLGAGDAWHMSHVEAQLKEVVREYQQQVAGI